MLRCNNCREFFKENEARIEFDDPSPRGIPLPPGSYTYAYCPHCGSDDYDDNFDLASEIDIDSEDDMSVNISFEGKSFLLYIDESGEVYCEEREVA